MQIGEPKTPIFKANPGDQVRFRMTHPLGTGNSEVFTIHGHAWQRNPYQNKSTVIAFNNLSQWMGSRDNHGSTDHFDLVIPKAGGTIQTVPVIISTRLICLRMHRRDRGEFSVSVIHRTQPEFARLGQVRKHRLRQDRQFRI